MTVSQSTYSAPRAIRRFRPRRAPLATVVQDLLSIVIYLTAVRLIL